MSKSKNRVLFGFCVLAIMAMLAAMPAYADISVTSDDTWDIIKTDDCTTKECVMSRYEPFGSMVNTTYGFVSYTQHSGVTVDHFFGFDYGLMGNSELTFDMFINDIDYDVEAVRNHTSYREGIDLDIFKHDGSHNDNILNVDNGSQGWGGTLANDAGEQLKIGEYATAKRMYDLTPADGMPTHVNVKLVIQDGNAYTYKKWNTEENWICTMSRKLTKWEPAKHTMIYWIVGMKYIAVDNVTAKYNEPPKAEADRTHIKALGDTLTLTFSKEIGTYPAQLTLTNGTTSKQAAVTKADEYNFTVTVADLEALSTYTGSLSDFKGEKNSLECDETLTIETDFGDLGTSVYTNAKREDFDGESGIRWEKTEDNIETGYTIENGMLNQTINTAEIRMRNYFASDYYAEFKAVVDKSISFAMCTADGTMYNKVTFNTEDGKISSGEYTFTTAAEDGNAKWFAANDNGVVYLGEFPTDLTTAARPVISSEGTVTKIDYVTVNLKPDADMSDANRLNEIIKVENEEIERKEEAFSAVNTAVDTAAMQEAISSTYLNVYSDDFFTDLGDDTDTYKTAYAEIILNERNLLASKQFKDLNEYEKYTLLALRLLKLSHYSGEKLTAELDKVSYDGIENTDDDYNNTKTKIGEAFEQVRADKLFKTYDEVKTVFIEAKALGVLNSAATRDAIPAIITKYAEALSLDLTEYNKKSAIAVAPALHEKNFTSKKAVQDAIDDKIKALNKASGGSSGTGSSGSSGGSSSGSSNKNGNSVVMPGASIGTKSTPSPSEPPTTPVTVPSFNDLDNVSWGKNAIEALAKKGIISGVSSNEYQPSRNVTRAEFVKMITESFGLVSNGEKEFSDVSADAWYAKYVNAAATNGIVNGINEFEFAPDNAITKQDAALIIFKCAEAWTAQKNTAPADMENIADYAEEAVKTLFQSGVISGNEEGMFEPKKEITRAEAACMLYNALEVLNKI